MVLARRDPPGASDAAPAVAPAAPDDGAENRRDIEPEDEPERDPASTAGVPRR
jgi:hypothetical protein